MGFTNVIWRRINVIISLGQRRLLTPIKWKSNISMEVKLRLSQLNIFVLPLADILLFQRIFLGRNMVLIRMDFSNWRNNLNGLRLLEPDTLQLSLLGFSMLLDRRLIYLFVRVRF